ncbi:hypothetical protein GA0115261_1053311 [Streptomyces sp. OspMP-M43]|nr:hypothetical protein GA0115261_1053311 [Streptomyces sp. OspMP-M43]
MRTTSISRTLGVLAADDQKTLSEKARDVNKRSENPYPK